MKLEINFIEFGEDVRPFLSHEAASWDEQGTSPAGSLSLIQHTKDGHLSAIIGIYICVGSEGYTLYWQDLIDPLLEQYLKDKKG